MKIAGSKLLADSQCTYVWPGGSSSRGRLPVQAAGFATSQICHHRGQMPEHEAVGADEEDNSQAAIVETE
jgi:hypothetical protein